MNKSDLDTLRNRWAAHDSEAGVHWLLGKGTAPFPNLGDGRADLRGLAVMQFIKNVMIRKADLSGASTDGFGQFGMCSVEGCRFCNSKLTTNLGSYFEDCDFTSANMSGSVIRGKFIGCNFTLANLTGVMGAQVQFVRCVFSNTNFKKATLTHCLFEECEFERCKFGSGSLAYSKFVRSHIESEELGNTMLE